MKKILVSLLVLAMCAPAMAATISIAAGVNPGEAVVTIDATADGVNIVGLGLDVDVTAGAVTAVSIDTPDFNIYPDAAYTQELGAGYVYGTGTPVAAKTVPGEVALSDSFALSFANLNGEATAGADGSLTVQVTLTLSETADLTVCENATRGGIVAVDGTALDAACATETITVGGGDCYTGPDFAQWELVGKPDSWCADRQCYGDADNAQETIAKQARWVGYNDIDILLEGFNKVYAGEAWIAADFDHAAETIAKQSRRVGYNDIDVLLLYFNQATVPADCNP